MRLLSNCERTGLDKGDRVTGSSIVIGRAGVLGDDGFEDEMFLQFKMERNCLAMEVAFVMFAPLSFRGQSYLYRPHTQC